MSRVLCDSETERLSRYYPGESSWIDWSPASLQRLLALWDHLWLNGTTTRMETNTIGLKTLQQLQNQMKFLPGSCFKWPIWEFYSWTFQGWFLWPPFGGSSWVTNGRSWWTKITTQSLKQVSHEKKPPTFHYTGCLKGILIMVYYNPHKTGQ